MRRARKRKHAKRKDHVRLNTATADMIHRALHMSAIGGEVVDENDYADDSHAPPSMSPIPTQKSQIESVVVGSSLYQVLSLLSLSRLHDARNMSKIVQTRELASLAFARVVEGKIILEVDPDPGIRRRKRGSKKSQGQSQSHLQSDCGERSEDALQCGSCANFTLHV